MKKHSLNVLGRALSHILFLAALTLFAVTPLAAQQEDDEGDGIDLGFIEPQDNGLDFSFAAFPWLERKAVVLYETLAQAYIRLSGGNTSSYTTLYYSISESTNNLTPIVVTNDGHVLANLPLNRYISLFAYDASESLRKIGELSTYRYEEDVIPLPIHLYKPITNWLQGEPSPGENLYTFVAGLSDAHYLEKAGFIQQFFYGGFAFPDGQIGQMPPSPTVSNPESDCLCRPLQLTVTEDAAPLGNPSLEIVDAQNGNYLPDYKTGEETSKKFGNNNGKRWYAYSYEGAAKYQQVWIETKKCVGGYNKMQMDNLSLDGDGTAAGPSAGNRSMLSYAFACVGIDDFRPQDCPCARPRRARVCWRYAGRGTSRS
jgi:hypothetical protein